MINTVLPDPATCPGKEPSLMNNAVIINQSSHSYYYPEHLTPFMIIANPVSAGSYILNNKKISTSPHHFYAVNAGSRLAIDFRKQVPKETLLVLFSGNWLSQAYHSITLTDKALLDNPGNQAKASFNISSIPFITDNRIQQLFMLLKNKRNDPLPDTETELMELLYTLLQMDRETAGRIKAIRAARIATREELYRRLVLAESFMKNNLHVALTIDDMANTACLNRFHFIRIFKQVYGISPHQYFVQLKLARAHELLTKKEYTVSDVCYRLGFESTSSFCHLFKRCYNITPSQLLQ